MSLAAPDACPVCDCRPRASFRLRNGARLLRCPRCLLGWWHWPAFSPAGFYDRDYFQSAANKGYADYAALEPGIRRTARGRLRRLEELQRRGSGAGGAARRDLLEIGCGTGCFLDEARQRGWNARGIEVSAYAAEQARARGLMVQTGAIEDMEIAERFDVVALWDVLEHVRDPRQTIQAAARALRPGGLLALSTGDVTSLCARLSGRHWHLFNLPEHLFFFSPRCLALLMKQTSLRLLKITREVNWSPLSYLAERLTKPFGMQPPAALAGSGIQLPATLLDVLGVHARKHATRAADPPAR